jgi:hypothetical protein
MTLILSDDEVFVAAVVSLHIATVPLEETIVCANIAVFPHMQVTA